VTITKNFYDEYVFRIMHPGSGSGAGSFFTSRYLLACFAFAMLVIVSGVKVV